MDTNYWAPMPVVRFTFPFSLSSFSPYLSSYPSLTPAAGAFLSLSAAVPPQSLPSSPRSAPSAFPRTPRGCGRKHCGRVFYRRAIWGNSGLQRDGR